MSAEITTVIGQLNIVEGSWRGDAPNQAAVREPKSADRPGAGKGDLFVQVEVRGQAGNREAIERQLAEIIRDSYYLAEGSTTACLRRAMQSAGDLLYDRNDAVSVDERLVGGAAVLVMRGEDAFVAQIGPTACFAVLGDYVRRYPTESVWLDEALDPPLDGEEPALGLSAVVEPNLHHLRVGPEDFLVLADSGLAGQMPLEVVVRAVGAGNIKAAIKNLGNMAQAQNCSALVLGVVERAQPALGPLKVSPSAQLSKLFHRSDNQLTDSPSIPTAAEMEDEPVPVPVGPSQSPESNQPIAQKSSAWRQPLARRTKHGSETNGKSHGQAGQQSQIDPQARPSTFSDEEDPERESLGRGKVLASMAPESTFRAGLHRSHHGEESSSRGRVLRWLGMGLLMLVALLGNGLKAIFSLVLPKNRDYGSRQAGMQAYRHHQSATVPWALLRNIAIAIPLLVAVIVGISYLQKGRMREAEYQELLTTAQTKFQQAQAVDPSSAVGLIGEANAFLTQAEQIKPDQPEIAELRQNMVEEADRLGNVQRLYYLPQLRQYTDVGTNLKSIVVQGVEVYVLDIGNGRVFHHRLDDLGEALLPDDEGFLLVAQGQAVDGLTISNLLGMTWVPAGGNRQTSDLVILSNAGLLEYHPNWGITISSMAGSEALIVPAAVSSFFGNFYVLDPQANKLWRYLPTADGYSAQPESYFPAEQPVDLTNAIDFAIDGAIYVLFQDGRIGKYLSGESVDFNVSGLDIPLNNPVAIFTAPNEEVQHIYVADAGNQRVVQLNKDGSFVRQFKPRAGEAVSFVGLQDIFVDEIGGRLYVLDSNNLYVGNIPNE